MVAPALTAYPLSAVQPEAIQWLWERYLPRGKLVLLDGDPNVGKSFLSIDIAARLSRGAPLPDGTPSGKAHGIVILSAEDRAEDTIRPRAEAAGADLNRIHVIRAFGHSSLSFPRDTEALERLIAELGADLVIIDPFLAFLPPSIPSNSYQCVRGALDLLAVVAEHTRCTMLLIRHLRKAGADRAIHRGLGSIGIMGTVREALLAARVPGDPSLSVLAVSKPVFTSAPPALTYRVTQNGEGRAIVEWLGPHSFSADDLGVAVPGPVLPRDRAADWLLRQVASGPRPASEILAAAAADGIPERTLRRAKEIANVKSFEAELVKNQRAWFWFDPAAPWPKDARIPRPEDPPMLDWSFG